MHFSNNKNGSSHNWSRSNNNSNRPNKKPFKSFNSSQSGSTRHRSSFTNNSGFNHREARANSFVSNRFKKNQYARPDEDKPIPIKDEKLEELLKAAIIKVLREDEMAMPLFVLINKTIREVKRSQYKGFIEKGEIIWVINKLKANSTVNCNIREKYYLEYLDYPVLANTEAEGVFKSNLRGNFGHVIVKTKGQDPVSYYVHKRNFHQAIDGDLVKFIKLDTSSAKKKMNSEDVKIIEIISHPKDQYVGEVVIDSSIGIEAQSYFAKLDNPKIAHPVKILNPIGIVEGHKVLLKIVDFNPEKMTGEIVKILGHKNDVGVDIESIVYDNGVEINFSALVNKEIDAIDHSLTRFENQSMRQDLTDVAFVTIDPATSKDFDDAIFVAKKEDHYLLRVAIADVTSYVPFRSALDEAAENRGSSVYLVNSVIPMLPHLLSNDLCSLNPNVKRCAVVCDMKLNFAGEIDFSSVDVFPALIKSHRRFSYDEINAYFKKEQTLDNELPVVKASIDAAYELFFQMEKVKKTRGYINFFALFEPKILVDENNHPTQIQIYQTWHAQNMIEDFMVAANEAVTAFANKHDVPFIYRVHGLPALKKMERFSLLAKKLNFKITTQINDQMHPGDIAKWIEANKDNPYNTVIHMLLLRTMDKAVYSHKNTYHFGLASKHYTHFTSPIRRYPDMIVHRLFWMYCFDRNSYTDHDRAFLKNRLEELSLKSSEAEVRAVKTERDVNAYKFAEYMQQFVGNEFEATVIEVNPKGCYVQLDNLIQGFAPMALTKFDFFRFDPISERLVGQNSHTPLDLCTTVLVKVHKVDLQLASIDFEIIDVLKQPKSPAKNSD
ncbi:ribonuclease R [Mycoplasmoides fastidiosum]|uniref:Ribonuclease R n=1 Tax=Mycoplasmoides fastidiosum TaxID=92758 RepID=A0ABU0M069_9BACT|nr:ribonuclease R [Mycoplasmoides fastidiosum]MDQ0514338.1 ribonuclease R [Mycoplasmoides fastidiosum]UUD38060.1 ribonuclease R [Mycoplasmoides fastidiosum]